MEDILKIFLDHWEQFLLFLARDFGVKYGITRNEIESSSILIVVIFIFYFPVQIKFDLLLLLY